MLLLCAFFILPRTTLADEPNLDPAAWGSDHVGQKFPEYLTGDECLFCHRNIGPTWDVNPHQRTFQPAIPDSRAIKTLALKDETLAKETKLLLGANRMTRFLRRSSQYGKLEMLSAKYVPAASESAEGTLIEQDSMHWNATAFANKCAGCHTTAVDTESRTYSTISLDCVTCHGLVELEHTDDVSLVFLSKKSQDPKVVTSICGQCHLRGGKSKSSGLPYPNTFVPGDNLFRDFEVSLTKDAIGQLPIIEQHIYLNVFEISVLKKATDTCVSCHDVHGNDSTKHQDLNETKICASCHKPDTDNSELLESLKIELKQRSNSETCAY